MASSTLRAALLMGIGSLIGASHSWAQQPLTISVVPMGSTELNGGTTIALEVFLTVNVDTCTGQPPGPTNPNGVRIEGGQIDMPCSLPGGPSGTISIVTPGGATTDPDGDGMRGPSFEGIPFLFGQSGLGLFQVSTCIIALTPALGATPENLAVGETRYLGTYFYRASDCAAGSFDAALEGFTNPPVPTNTTRLRDDCPANPATGVLLGIEGEGSTLSVPVGRCCRGSECLGEVNERCCEVGLVGNSWTADATCADGCPCQSAGDCNDGNLCTIDRCSAGQCVHEDDLDRCDDDEPCTLDRCDSRSGACQHVSRCVYGDVAPQILDCAVNDEDWHCVLDGFAVLPECARGDVYPCLGDDDITFDDLLATLAASAGQPACPDPFDCD